MVPTQGAYEKDYTNTQYDSYNAWHNPSPQQPPAASIDPPKAHPMRFNAATKEIIFDQREDKCPLRAGDWIIIRSNDDLSRPLHCRVANTTFYPTIKVAEPVRPALPTVDTTQSNYYPPVPPTTPLAKPPQAQASPPSDEFRPAAYYAYDQNFDELHDYHKRTAIYALLDAIPCVSDMRQYLIRKAQSPLSSWVDRLSPAALGILRWIIASNRACIMQVADEGEIDSGKKGEERLYGMTGWSQFRFAMGAPDKERKFLQAVRDTTNRLKLKHSTIFAWHGSPIMNWHSIIREGLHFNHTSHGRAYGHGVYHSLDVNTSIGYSGIGPGTNFWPMSELKLNSALALNEVVNAPKEFVSSSPHLVVAQLDWIQTRYLFVKTQSSNSYLSSGAKESKPADFIEQDPNMTPRGSSDAIVIPVHAIAGSRRPQTRTVKPSTTKRRKTLGTGSTAYDPINLDGEDDDGASVCTLDEDRVILEDEPTFEPDPLPTPNSTKGKSKAGNFLSKLVGSKSSSSSAKPLTDYVPGTLDFSTLPMLKAPQWATPAATKRLMKDFQDLVKLQDGEPPHELGWYIDPEAHENMYQWIVELHSFDPTLPLAKDMKTHGHKSIVLELRFGNQYPMNPPFVRVIRPKFLGFNQGGGGHVTLGGAMCMQVCDLPIPCVSIDEY
jgi:ubiquitin-conjugating enzyme E2 Q